MKLKDLNVGDHFYFAGDEEERGYKDVGYAEFSRVVTNTDGGYVSYEYVSDGSKWFFGPKSRWQQMEVVVLERETSP